MSRRDFLSRLALFVVGAADIDLRKRSGPVAEWGQFCAGCLGLSVLSGDGASDDTHGLQTLVHGGDVYDRRRRMLRRGTDFDTDVYALNGTATVRSGSAMRNAVPLVTNRSGATPAARLATVQ